MRKHYGERMGEIPSRMKNRAAPISRVLFPFRGGGHLSGLWVSPQLKRPTRGSRGSGQAPAFAFPPYLALLRVGVASFRCYHRNWWALTPPFHPCPHPKIRAAGGLFSVALSRGRPLSGFPERPALRSPDLPQGNSPLRLPVPLPRRGTLV